MSKRTLGQVLREMREAASWSQGDLAVHLGWDKEKGGPRISQWENNKRVPTPAVLAELAAAFGTTIEAILSQVTTQVDPETENVVRFSHRTGEYNIVSQARYEAAREEVKALAQQRLSESANPDAVEIQYLAGKPYERRFEPIFLSGGFLRGLRLSPGYLRLLDVESDNMAPVLRPGDTVLINLRQREIRDGKLFAIDFAGEPRVKRCIRRVDGSVLLRNDNAAYDDEIVPADQAGALKIHGQVVWRCGLVL